MEIQFGDKIQLTQQNQANVNTVAGQISPTNNIASVAGANLI